jgi:hypothetical protein
MNKYAILIMAVLLATLFISVTLGMRFSYAVLLYGLVAVILAPIAIHMVEKPNISIGLIVGLSVFASFPARRLYQLDGFIESAGLTIAYAVVLFIVGFGWKRSWKAEN